MIELKLVGSKIKPKLQRLKEKQSKLLANEIYQGVSNLTPVKTGKAKQGWKLLRRSFGFIIINNVPYIGSLNKGSSPKAERGMTRPTLEALKAGNKLK
tara:strand:+ start:1439 stop:1732 length:294 start_codon:yes stop_codon:yes gene_type:complete